LKLAEISQSINLEEAKAVNEQIEFAESVREQQ